MIQIVVLKWFIQTGLSKNGTWVLKINIIKHSTWQNDLSRTYTWSVNKVIRNRRPSVYDELLLDEETCCYLWQMLARRPCSAVVWQLEHVSNFPDSGVYVHVYAEFLTWYILMIWIPNHPYSACPCWLDYFGSSKISCAIISNHGSGAPVWATVNGQLLFSKNDKPSYSCCERVGQLETAAKAVGPTWALVERLAVVQQDETRTATGSAVTLPNPDRLWPYLCVEGRVAADPVTCRARQLRGRRSKKLLG